MKNVVAEPFTVSLLPVTFTRVHVPTRVTVMLLPIRLTSLSFAQSIVMVALLSTI
jgi:hypothetical protein